MSIRPFAPALFAGALVASPAFAQEAAQPDLFVRGGIAYLDLADKGPVFVNGIQDPSADYKTDKDWIGSFEIGYFILPPVAIQFTATTPAETFNLPAGSLAGTPNLFNDTSSNFTLTATFHPLRGKTVSPYIGGGFGVNHIWSVEEKLATDVEISDSWGPVLQAGIEFNINERWGIYVDAKKAWWSADASGFLGPAFIEAEAELDPVILSAGAVFRF